MRITRVERYRYRVPFRRVFITSHGEERSRDGFILRLHTDEGRVGLGEAAPLHAFGTGTVDKAEKHLACLTPKLLERSLDEVNELIDALPDDPLAAPVRFALDTAVLDIQAQREGVPLCRYLSEAAVSRVPVNATIGAENTAKARSAAVAAVNAGYRAVKLKVGVLHDRDDEIDRIAVVRDAIGPDTELRLDANGAWSFVEALDILRRTEELDISYVEQPLHPENIEGMAELRCNTSVPVAADEAATTSDAIDQIILRKAADVLIVKPGVIGGLRPSRNLIERAHAAGLGVVVTTALETGIGIAAALHLAATLPQPIPACGLATGALLESDLFADPLQIDAGHMRAPEKPGLGVGLDGEAATYYERERADQGG